MTQQIVVSSKDGRLGNPEEAETKLIVFGLADDQVVSVRDVVPAERDVCSLVYWLTRNNITKLYVSTVSALLYRTLTSFGIVVKQKDEVADDPFYCSVFCCNRKMTVP